MIITGKHIFNVVYVFNLIFHTLFISYQLIQHNTLDAAYLIVAGASIAVTTLIYIITKESKLST
ncbi:hypothetical protein AB3331_06680 [Streptococcus sp. H49]|uniref:hypothetical protein n=1 Tax=Streptococcus huangxiaojuni TaxID=3237239 RepID=UPI0034A4FB2A